MAESLAPLRKKARLMGAYLRGRPVWCTWQLTPRCGAHCAFCEHRAEGGVEEATSEEAIAISQSFDAIGTMVVSLSGGEPFLREDLASIVGTLSATHFVLLTTHGFLVTESRARAVWESGLDGASVVLEDANPEQHDGRVGVPGAFRRAVAALECLARTRARPGQQVNVKTRVSPDRHEHLPRLLDIAERFGATVSVEAAYPVAQGTRSDVSARLVQLKRNRSTLRTRASVLARFDEASNGGVGGCLAAKAFLNVDHLGRVSRCAEIRPPEEVIADLRRPTAPGELLAALNRVHRANTCRSCWSGSRGEVEAVYSLRGLVSLLPDLLRS